MEMSGIDKKASPTSEDLSCSIRDGMLTIGHTTTQVYQPRGNQAKVPDVVFYDTNQVF